MSEGEADSAREHEDPDSCDELRRHANLLGEQVDVLAKLKMQVRDIKVPVIIILSPFKYFIYLIVLQDDFDSRHLTFPLANRTPSAVENFQLPVPFPFPHPAAAFLPPLAPQPAAPSSGSSHSSEGSASSQQTWSFEEQFKQVRQVCSVVSYRWFGFCKRVYFIGITKFINYYASRLTGFVFKDFFLTRVL